MTGPRVPDAWPQPEWSEGLIAALEGETQPGRQRLRALSTMMRDAQAHLEAVREKRFECAEACRDAGVAMVDIGRWADLDDAYLSRKLIERGAPPRYGRATGRRDDGSD